MALARNSKSRVIGAGSVPTGSALILTIDEAAEVLRISRQSAYEAARRGEIPTIRLGRRILVPRRALEKLIGAEIG
jgi:excisionase family DNA binding protein